MADERHLLRELIERSYGAQVAGISPLPGSWEGGRYRVDLADGRRWVLRVFPADIDLRNDVAALRFLGACDYPTERLVPALQDQPVLIEGGRQILVTTFVAGRAADFSRATLYRIGEMLGLLHALDPSQAPLPLPPASMRPATEVSWALGNLYQIESEVPGNLRLEYEALLAALGAIDRTEPPHTALIHNDAHPGNTLITAGNEVRFIDWSGAGLGSPEIDVGFLLMSCDTESPWTPPLPPDPARVAAIVDGYCRHRMLTAEELDRLPDAARFRSLVYGAADLIRRISAQGQPDMDAWWWARYRTADEVTARARRQFETHRQG